MLRLDPELRRYLATSRPETFTTLAAELQSRFALTLSPDAAAHLWRWVRTVRPGRISRFRGDDQVMTFIADRADLHTTSELRASVARTFGEARTPSRSQLSRLIREAREHSATEFTAGGGSADRKARSGTSRHTPSKGRQRPKAAGG